MFHEKRTFKRVAVALDVFWEGESASSYARMSDLSLGGCHVKTARRVAVGEPVTVDAFLPGGTRLRLRGEVAHRRWPTGFGLRFTGLTDAQIGALLRVTGEADVRQREAVEGWPPGTRNRPKSRKRPADAASIGKKKGGQK